MFYDALLLLAIYFGVTAALLYFTDGEPIPPGHAGYRLLLIAICWLFHIGFWRRAGRTLGFGVRDGSGAPLGEPRPDGVEP